MRLDHWVEKVLENKTLVLDDFKRIIITVQAKRKDSISQMQYLKRMGISVVLVRGNNLYLENTDIINDVYHRIQEIIKEFDNIILFGISQNMIDTIFNRYDIDLSEKIMGIFGESKGIATWVYYCQHELSEDAIRYLERRNSKSSNYISKELCKVENRNLYIFVDLIDKKQYLSKLHNLDQHQNHFT